MKQIKISSMVLLLLCMGITGVHAQQSANAAGGDASGSGGSVSYSVGQVVYTYISASSGSSGQGVQQPYEIYAVGINEVNSINLSVTVFPNPAQSMVNLKIQDQTLDNLSFQLYDINGQILITQKINEALTEIPMQGLASGPYILRVSDRQKAVKTFTILKYN